MIPFAFIPGIAFRLSGLNSTRGYFGEKIDHATLKHSVVDEPNVELHESVVLGACFHDKDFECIEATAL